MPSTQENNKSNQKLIGIRIALKEKRVSEEHLDRVLQKLNDVNTQIAATDYLKLHRPYWIGNTILHFAYQNGHQGGLKAVLDKNPNIDFTIKNRDNLTILHLILQHRHTTGFRFPNLRSTLNHPCIDMILSAHVKTRNCKNPCDSNGMSHFHIACMANHAAAVEFFLDNNVPLEHAINIDSPYFPGFTGLHLAIRCCSLLVTKTLLKLGASIYVKNAEGMTALHMVIDNCFNFANNSLFGCFGDDDVPKKSANEEVAKLLLKAINADKTMIIDNDSGLSCLHFACTMMGNRIVKKLATKGDINHPVNMQSLVLPGYTPLHFAVHANCINIAKILVKNGADLFAKDAHGKRPFDLYIERCKTEDIHGVLSANTAYKEITFTTKKIKLLNLILALRDCEQFQKFLKNYCNTAQIQIPKDVPLWPGFTPMHLLVLFSSLGNFSRINFEESFWNLKRSDVNIMTHCIASKKYLDMIMEFHYKNPKIMIVQDADGRTPLHLSFCLGKIRNVVDLLLKLHNKIRFPLDLVDNEDLSLLHIACSRDNKELVKKLLIRSKNVNLAYKGKSIRYIIETGWTPLHVAVAYDKIDIAKILLRYGADVHSQDVHGITPIHLTILRGIKSASLLLSVADLKECVVNDMGLSHLHVACFLENADAVKKLLDNGSAVNLAITCDPKIAHKSFELSRLVKFAGYTPLNFTRPACGFYCCFDYKSKDLPETIKLVLQCGADIFVKNSDRMPFAFENFGYFLSTFKEDINLQKQAEIKFGITNLHLACFAEDIDWLKNLLEDDTNVNKKLHMDFPKWGGSTPLHIVMEKIYRSKRQNEFVTLLLEKGADVTIYNANQKTPLHLAGLYGQDYGEPYLNSGLNIIKALKDFSINPMDTNGISHFHVACDLGEVAIVKKFLERGNVDINQPTDFFKLEPKRSTAGFTPLHFAAISDRNGVSIGAQLKTIDLLLKHGADPNLQDSRGNTALHITQRCEVFERIARGGADMNIVNMDGDTPFGSALFPKPYGYQWVRVNISTDEIINRLRCGSNFNAFKVYTNEGYIAMTLQWMPFKELQNLIEIITVNMPDTIGVDEMDRTAIHNLVSFQSDSIYVNDDEAKLTVVQYASLIELLASTGCDIDSQDSSGRTALHLAAEFRNLKAISALLMAGADVNILDKKGNTALDYHIGLRHSCGNCPRNAVPKSCEVFKVLGPHAVKLRLCQLEVKNSSWITSKFLSEIEDNLFDREVEEMNNLKFEPYNLTLGSFISEIDAVARYPMMEQSEKDVINEFFSRDKISHFREKFNEVAGLLSLQYRKAVKRGPLIDKTLISLNVLADFPVPQLCSHIILGFLSNDDLKNLIASTSQSKVQKGNSKVDSHDESSLKTKKLRIR